MAEKSKDPKDPFGGLLYRSREQVVPVDKKEDVATSFAQKREEMKKATLSKADEAIVENETAKIRNDTARLDAEYLELRARLAQGQVPIGSIAATDGAQRFTGTTKVISDILQLGQQTGINVMPLITQVLTGQPPTPPPTAQSMDGIPNPIIAAFGKIIEKSFDNNTKPHEDAKMLVLEERLKNQEQLINKELSDLKNLLIQQRGEVKDPAQTMTDSVKSLTALMAALKGLTPEAPPITGNSAELAFKYQDREWLHKEKQLDAELKKAEIAATMEVERQKLEQSRNNLAEIPQMIGAVVAQSLMEGGKGTGAAPAPTARKQKVDTLKVFKSKGLPHGAINYPCPECHADIAFVTSAKSVNCISCGSTFGILLEETEAPAANQPAAKPAPQEEPAAVSTSDDDYLFRRGS